jgi:hypothetical protein
MIQLSKNYSLPERAEDFIPIKIVSVGGAGLNALDRIVLDGLEGAEVLAVNTDVQSLHTKYNSAGRSPAAWARVATPRLAIRPPSNLRRRLARH